MGLASLITVTTSTTVGLANSSFEMTNDNSNLTYYSRPWSTGTSNPESDLAYEVSGV